MRVYVICGFFSALDKLLQSFLVNNYQNEQGNHSVSIHNEVMVFAFDKQFVKDQWLFKRSNTKRKKENNIHCQKFYCHCAFENDEVWKNKSRKIDTTYVIIFLG